MASNFIPMLSSSPPPLDDCPDNDDEDEEFGTFTSANIAFDSSFDSPVAGEKYNNFIKTGENGINDLNAFPAPTQNFTLSFSQQNRKNPTVNKSDKDVKILSNSDNKISDECRSSTKKHNAKNKDCRETSQNCVPHVLSDSSSCDSYKENDRSKRKQSLSQSNEGIESNSVHSNIDCSDGDVENSFPLSPSNEIEKTETSKDVYIPCGVVDDSFQSTGFDVTNCDEPLDFSEECVNEQSSCNKGENSEVLQESIKNAESDSDNSKVEFPTDFAGSDSFEEDFDAFQGVHSLDDVPVKGGLFFNGSVNESDTFEANFDDFQTFKKDKSSEFSEFKTNEGPSDSVEEKEEPSEISKEFADFKASEVECHSDIDEFDDFQSFDKAGGNISFKKSETEAPNESPVKASDNDHPLPNSFGEAADQDDFDEFDDFQACSEVAAPVEQSFATFQAAESFKDKGESESPEFADFEQASFSSTSGETYPNSPCLSSSSHNQEKNVDKLSTVMNAIFPPQEEPSDIEVSYDPELEIVDQSIKSRRLWEKLHEAEQTPGLRFQWGVSHSFQQLLRSVNVDYHSILRTSSVPIFASGLSLLEPMKGQTNSVNPELEDKAIPSPRDPIPPVEFDWNSSGLVNPLDTGQSASILMDLSFLSSSSTASSSRVVGDHSFENELLKPSPAPAFPENTSKTFILEELLSKNICSIPISNTPHRSTNLSEEANTVLDQLPDLSYMRAKVLMFPISSKT